nr:MAG TPA: hypothetical protein [Caudoviricetes sp.]
MTAEAAAILTTSRLQPVPLGRFLKTSKKFLYRCLAVAVRAAVVAVVAAVI